MSQSARFKNFDQAFHQIPLKNNKAAAIITSKMVAHSKEGHQFSQSFLQCTYILFGLYTHINIPQKMKRCYRGLGQGLPDYLQQFFVETRIFWHGDNLQCTCAHKTICTTLEVYSNFARMWLNQYCFSCKTPSKLEKSARYNYFSAEYGPWAAQTCSFKIGTANYQSYSAFLVHARVEVQSQ